MIALVSCEGSQMLPSEPVSDVRLDRRAFAPSFTYQTWWAEVAACAGVEGDLSRVRFFEVVSPVLFDGQQFPCGGSALCNGMWERPHDISIAPTFTGNEHLVKHEMLHDLLNVLDHPAEFEACGVSWDFERRGGLIP